MGKAQYKRKAVGDTHFTLNMATRMVQNGWKLVYPKIRDHKGERELPFMYFFRTIDHPKKSPNLTSGTNQPSGKTSQIPANSAYLKNVSAGAKHTMGGAHSVVCPQPSAVQPAVPAAGQSGLSISQIPSLAAMRGNDPEFVIAFDSEFYTDSDNIRHVLSWQFAYELPDDPDHLEELLIVSRDGSCAALSQILDVIFQQHPGLLRQFHSRSVDYRETRIWEVPVVNKSGNVALKRFRDFDSAVDACCDDDYKKALIAGGRNKKCIFELIPGENGRDVSVPRADCVVKGWPLGYLNDYKYANKESLPVTILCHTGSADLTTLCVDSKYEKDLLKKVSAVQGGLVSLEEFYMHNARLIEYWSFIPVVCSVRDTMCYAPAKKKSLADLGETIGVPKLDVPAPYSKSDMLSFMQNDLKDFCEYAVNDSVVTLCYAGELWGYNVKMPVTVTSASVHAAVPVLQKALGVSKSQFNEVFRGLELVKKGKGVKQPYPGAKPAYYEKTRLEPISQNASILQGVAQNSYRGGYNGCMMVGYFPFQTWDYDLENAYPTCMSLVPDIDWENPIVMELKEQWLNPTLIRSPFDPIFGYVEFEFPETVKYPCISMSIDGNLVYVRKSKRPVYASAPELYLALRLGAKVYAHNLYVGNVRMTSDGRVSHSLFYAVKQLVNDRADVRSMQGEHDGLMQLLLKQAVNSLYGKTAQDVIEKHTWDSMTEEMENIGGSPVTSPVHACLTTAGVRAVLLATMNQLHDMGRRVFSVTTDGFISDASFDELNSLDLYGFAPAFRAARLAITTTDNHPGSDAMWAVKHQQKDLLNFTTRGNASLNVGDPEHGVLPGVMAHNSYVSGYDPDSRLDRLKTMYEVCRRRGRIYTVQKAFTPFRQLSRGIDRLDFLVRDQERELSMDFDLKRKPLKESVYTEIISFDRLWDMNKDNPDDPYYPFPPTKYKLDRDDVEIACFDTSAYEDEDEFQLYKKTGAACTVLATEEDWDIFFAKVSGKKTGNVQHIKDVEWSKLFSCVMAYRLGVPIQAYGGTAVRIPYLDSPDHTVQEKVDWINQFNTSRKKFNVNSWKDCRKQSRASQMLPESIFIDKLDQMVNWTPPAPKQP